MPVTISGTTGVNATGNIQATGNIIGTGICPTGVVLPFAISTTPTGWLVCDGTTIPTTGTFQSVDASLLQTLRSLLGTTYGSTGQLPNLQGQFIRGLTTNLSTASRDPLSGSRVLGNVQDDAFQGHWHQYTGTTTDVAGGIGGIIDGPNTQIGGGGSLILGPITDGSNGAPRTANETRPVNIALLYCIKY